MSARNPTLTKAQLEQYDRLMLRSAMASLFWAVIADRREHHGYKLQHLADAIGMDKSGVSRWFSGNNPNWTLNTIADIAGALNVDLRVEVVDRETGAVYSSQGRRMELPEAPKLIEAAEEQAPFHFQAVKSDVEPSRPNAKTSAKPARSARHPDSGRSRARHPGKARSRKGSSQP